MVFCIFLKSEILWILLYKLCIFSPFKAWTQDIGAEKYRAKQK